jgi:general secretion pathway protein M
MTNAFVAALRERSLAFWQERGPRERNVLAIGAGVLVIALVYALLIAPAIEGRKQLQAALPQLRQQVAEMQALSQQAAQLAGASAAAPSPATKETIEASLRDKGLKAQAVTVDGELVRVQLAAVSFAALLDWLSDAQRTARLAVIDASIAAQATPDTVNATLALRQSKSGSE